MFCNFYPFYENAETFECELLKKYPFVKKKCIGKSTLGRNINAFLIGKDISPCLFVSTVHGAEWLNTLIMYSFLADLCRCYDKNESLCGFDIKKHLEQRGIWIVPCLNPDGVEINLIGSCSAGEYKCLVDSLQQYSCVWQANARGVDLNHNFPAGWEEVKRREVEAGIFSPSRSRYGGVKPLSENESMSIAKFCCEHLPRSAYAFHSQGREIYYDFGKNTPKKSFSIAKRLSEFSSYKISSPTGLAVGGGFKDWFIEKFHRPGFTFETGIGENPLPISDMQTEYEILKKALVFATVI